MPFFILSFCQHVRRNYGKSKMIRDSARSCQLIEERRKSNGINKNILFFFKKKKIKLSARQRI